MATKDIEELTAPQVGAALGRTRGTAHLYLRTGRIRNARQISRIWVAPRRDVLEFKRILDAKRNGTNTS